MASRQVDESVTSFETTLNQQGPRTKGSQQCKDRRYPPRSTRSSTSYRHTQHTSLVLLSLPSVSDTATLAKPSARMLSSFLPHGETLRSSTLSAEQGDAFKPPWSSIPRLLAILRCAPSVFDVHNVKLEDVRPAVEEASD